MPGKRHKTQVDSVEHQLDGHEHRQGTLSEHDTHCADPKKNRTKDQVCLCGHGTRKIHRFFINLVR
jgi:hypothetical protein